MRSLEMIARGGQDCTRFYDRLRMAFKATANIYEMVAQFSVEVDCIVVAFADGFSRSAPALAAFCATTRPFLLDIKLKEVHLRKHDVLSGSNGRRAWERSGIEMHPTDDGGIWIHVKSRELAVTVRERWRCVKITHSTIMQGWIRFSDCSRVRRKATLERAMRSDR